MAQAAGTRHLATARQGIGYENLPDSVVRIAISMAAFSQAQAVQNRVAVPKYDKSAKAVFVGTVQEVRDRQCPVSGGMGSRLGMHLGEGKIIVFHPGETVEITSVEGNFDGEETIFARKIKRGTEEFLFRDNDGKPIW